MQGSSNMAGIGRIVHVFCPDLWEGAQPGLVSCAGMMTPVGFIGAGEAGTIEQHTQTINVNALVDAARFPKALEYWRARAQGNTLNSVPLFEALGDEQRRGLSSDGAEGSLARRIDQLRCWVEWPPRG